MYLVVSSYQRLKNVSFLITGLPSISFANIRDFITRLQNINSAEPELEPKKSSSYDTIKSNLQKLKDFNQKIKASQKHDSIELPIPATTRPPYMYFDDRTSTALPQSLLASMVFDRMATTTRTTTTTTTASTTTTSTTTSTPFSMPTFFGAALTASPASLEIIESQEDVKPIGRPGSNPTRFHHVHHHHFNVEESPDDIQKW